MKRNIVLIGFMGTGKSTVARRLADRLNRNFFELDELIEKEAGKTINNIFKEEGGERFRDLESDMIGVITKREGGIISCGGGAVLRERNVKILKKNAVLIHLTASPQVILERIGDDENRPLLMHNNKIERIKELIRTRGKIYDRCADYTIDTSELGIEDVVHEIIEEVIN